MLARRLIVAFLVVTLPGTLLLGVVTVYSLRGAGKVSHELTSIALSLKTTRELQLALAKAEAAMANYLLNGEPKTAEVFDRAMRDARERLPTCATLPCHATQTPAQMAAQLAPLIEQFGHEGKALIAARPATLTELARIEQVHVYALDVGERLARMSRALLRRVASLGLEAHEESRRASRLVASLTAAVAVLACAAGVFTARRITRPVGRLLVGTRRVMAGDLEHQVAADPSGEIGELAASFNAMVRQLREYRGRLEEANRTLEARVRERTEELQRKDEALQRSERLAALGLLAAGVAHELNNPLTSIMMHANLLLEEAGEGSLARDLRKIDADASRCRRIIDDLRTFARGRELDRRPARVEELVEHALRLARHELASRAIVVERAIDAELPVVMWDPDRMVQVLTNLVTNAAQAMEEGGRLSLRCSRDDGLVRLVVEDDGEGIPAAARARIFDPFFTTKREGTGLGLSIAHGIVLEHGGRIDVESRGQDDGASGHRTGTTVTIVVPVHEALA
jgi:signal transduction histidine kinase